MELSFIDMLLKAIESNNIIVIAIIAAMIIIQQIISKRYNSGNEEMKTLIESLNAKIEDNSTNDEALSTRVSGIESKINEIYHVTTGKKGDEE